MAAYALEIGSALGQEWRSSAEIEFGFLLHDIGKIAIPDAILHKPEPLSGPERELMEQHPITGWEILRDIDFLGEAKLVVRHHHERWDGTGYPDRLRGEEIPLGARIIGVADAYDAMVSKRAYRRALTHDEARRRIERDSGRQFDPLVAAALLDVVCES